MSPAYRWISLAATAVVASTPSLAACAVDDGEPDSEGLTGAPEENLGQSAEATSRRRRITASAAPANDCQSPRW